MCILMNVFSKFEPELAKVSIGCHFTSRIVIQEKHPVAFGHKLMFVA